MKDGILYKGKYDYVQQTIIHIELQKFIYECLDLLELTDDIYCVERNDLEIFNMIDDNYRYYSSYPFKDHRINICGNEDYQSNTEIINNLNNFSKVLETLYDYKNKELIFNYQENNDNNIYNINYYKLDLNLKIEPNFEDDYLDDIILYYYNIKIKKIFGELLNEEKNINIPIYLTLDDTITIYGTFQTYIATGNYICKLFDYEHQCPKGLDSICIKGYKLLGDRYNNIFPFNKLIE
jgi:hypothetical protein